MLKTPSQVFPCEYYKNFTAAFESRTPEFKIQWPNHLATNYHVDENLLHPVFLDVFSP